MKAFIYFRNRLCLMLACVISIVSCKRLIELPVNPPDKLTQQQQFSDSATTMAAVIGVYTYHANGMGGFTFNDGLLARATGLSADEIITTENDVDIIPFLSNTLIPTNMNAERLWVNAYKGLYPVNAILEEVPKSSGLSASFKQQIAGEMKVLRSLYYFNLINLFGPVPLVLSTDYRINSVLPRHLTDEVYTQLLKDLKEAQDALPLHNPSSGRVRPNYYTATALLAKVHLYKNEWQAAMDAADTVIQSGVYTLETDLNSVFLDESQETIWHLPANIGWQTISDAVKFIPAEDAIAPYPLTASLLNAFEPGDLRRQNWVGISSVSGSQNSYYPYKYKNNAFGNATVEAFTILRLAELYLIRAEARIHLGDIAGGIDDLNVLRTRARTTATVDIPQPIPDLPNTLSEAAALKALMKERQTELFTEWGNRWFDLKRTGIVNDVLTPLKPFWNFDAALYPVPQGEREKNPFLQQNKGYR